MRIPSKIKIGGHVYKVVITKNPEFASCGRISRDQGTIEIRSSMVQSEREVTLFHEILHAINGEINETLVDSLAQQIYAVLKDNKLLR